MKKILLLLICIPTIVFSQKNYNIDSVINVLDLEINERTVYFNNKEEKIKQLKKTLSTTEIAAKRWSLSNQLFNEYKSYNYGFAYYYANKTIEIAQISGDKNAEILADCNLLFCLISTGLFKEASDKIASINISQARDSIKATYYEYCSRYYLDISGYNTDEPYNSFYRKQANVYSDSALMYIPKNSFEYKFIESRNGLSLDAFDANVANFTELYSWDGIDEHDKAITSSILGLLYSSNGEIDKSIYYTALSAIADIRSATRETTSHKELALYFFNKGDIQRASRYINIALEDANFYDARHRKLEINSILPIIEGERLLIVENQRNTSQVLLLLVSILVVIVGLILILLYSQIRKLARAKATIDRQLSQLSIINTKLEESNEIKDQYIIESLYGKSKYLDKIEEILKKIERKINNRIYDNIHMLYKDFDIKNERADIFTSFDNAFLTLFPSFIDEYNKLFLEVDQLKVNEDGSLPAEMRIFALIRLGVSENERIATFLNLSINTIYAYKAKVKSKTIIGKEQFEKAIISIPKATNF